MQDAAKRLWYYYIITSCIRTVRTPPLWLLVSAARRFDETNQEVII